MKKYFKIFVVCFCLVALLTVSCFATSAQTTSPVYGHYISPGEYVFVDNFSSSSFHSLVTLSFRFTINLDDFVYTNIDLNYPGSPGSTIRFFNSVSESYLTVYSSTWVNDAYRYITVLDGFYIYDSNVYQWWQSNVIRVSSGYSSSFFDSILSIFTGIGQWISVASANLVSIFYANEALTFVGTLAIAALAMAVSFLLIAFISRFLRFRG